MINFSLYDIGDKWLNSWCVLKVNLRVSFFGYLIGLYFIKFN